MSLVDDYESAVRGGNAPVANYLAQMLASQAGININANQVTAAPASLLPKAPSTSNTSFFGGIGNAINNATNTLMGPLLGNVGTPLGGGVGAVVNHAGDIVNSTDKAVKFITDIPRVATTLLGLILIIAGVFALAKGPAVQIVKGALVP